MASREYRAKVAFVVSAMFVLVILFLLQGVLAAFGGILVWSVLATIVAMLATSIGLNAEAPWARAITTPMLQIMVVSGAIFALLALFQQRIEIPIGAILGIWALNAPLATPLGSTDVAGAKGTAVLTAMLVGSFMPAILGLFA